MQEEPRKQNPAYTSPSGALDQVGGDCEILVNEVGRIGRVRMDSANLRCRDDHGVRGVPFEEIEDVPTDL